MAKNDTSQWDTTAGNNSDVGGINIAEGCAAANVNNALREMMAQIATARTGADTGIVTGTAGSADQFAKWNVDGDIVGGDLDATLTSIAALGTAANKGLYTTGVDTWAEFDLTAAGRALLDDADASAQRTTLGLGTAAVAPLLDEDDLSSDSSSAVPSQQSVKAYVDAQAGIAETIALGKFDGTGTPAFTFQSGFNASITDVGTGQYRLAFDAAEPDTNYMVNLEILSDGTGTANRRIVKPFSPTTSGFDILTSEFTGAQVDVDDIYVEVRRLT